MTNHKLNLFIVDDDTVMAKGLKLFLEKRFGLDLNITLFTNGVNAIANVNLHTNIVILDYNLKGENGNDILKAIKTINPDTEVIMLTSNEEIGIAIESFRKGAKDFVIKGNINAWKKVSTIVHRIIIYPVQIMVKEFGVSKYVAIFLLVFLTMGILVFIVLKTGKTV